MSLEVICPSCDKRYRVAEKFAGKSATCKACGAKMRVADLEPEPVAAASDPDGFDFGALDAVERTGTIDQSYAAPMPVAPIPAPAAAAVAQSRMKAPAAGGGIPRGLQYAAPGAGRLTTPAGGDTFVDKLRDTWLPIGMIAVVYAIPTLINVVAAFMRQPFGLALVNLIQTAVALGVLVRVVIPIAVYGLNIGARITEFEPPGDVAYRLFAAYCGVPASIALMLLLFAGSGAAGHISSITQLLTLVAVAIGIGLAVSYFLLWFLLRIGPGQAAVAWAFAGMFYILGAIAGIAVIVVTSCGLGFMFAGMGRH